MRINPDVYLSGVSYFTREGRMNELMEFLAGFVRLVHADRYYKSLLIKNRGSSYLDIITASDIAYIVSLIKNSDNVWLKRKTPDGDLVKSLYTSGKGIKRVYGVTRVSPQTPNLRMCSCECANVLKHIHTFALLLWCPRTKCECANVLEHFHT